MEGGGGECDHWVLCKVMHRERNININNILEEITVNNVIFSHMPLFWSVIAKGNVVDNEAVSFVIL